MDETPKPPPPKKITVNEAARYVRTHHHADVTRQTVYNWINKGVKGIKLRVLQVGHRRWTTKEWVDAFLNSLRP